MDQHLPTTLSSTAADVMTPAVVSASPETSVRDVAKLLLDGRISAIPVVDGEGVLLGMASGIKRVPVMRDGRMVGIVSRADLLRAVEAIPDPARVPRSLGGFADMIGGFFGGSAGATASASADPQSAGPAAPPLTADAFRHMVEASEQSKVDEKKAFTRAAEQGRQQQVKSMLQEHVGAEMWETLMTHARVAAAHGEKEIELLRFPAGLCTDGGRKINNADPAWAETLRGEAAEFHARWKRDLKPAGFGLLARVVDYSEGTPGNMALVLVWER